MVLKNIKLALQVIIQWFEIRRKLSWYKRMASKNILQGNEKPSLCDVLPFKINNEKYFLLISFICIKFATFP